MEEKLENAIADHFDDQMIQSTVEIIQVKEEHVKQESQSESIVSDGIGKNFNEDTMIAKEEENLSN